MVIALHHSSIIPFISLRDNFFLLKLVWAGTVLFIYCAMSRRSKGNFPVRDRTTWGNADYGKYILYFVVGLKGQGWEGDEKGENYELPGYSDLVSEKGEIHRA